MRIPLLILATCASLLIASGTAHATLFGVESNGELVNSNVTPTAQAAALDKMRAQGATIVRANFGWNEIAAACAGQTPAALRDPNNSCYAWGVADGLIQAATARSIQVLVTVSRAPTWLHNSSNPAYLGRTSSEWTRSVEHYEAFVGAMAQRYTAGSPFGTIRLWTVWNEPNGERYFAPLDTTILRSAAPRRYAQLFARSAVAIRGANPSALIALGPTGPQSTIKPITFIKSVQAALPTFLPGTGTAEKSYISAWAHNPYPGISTPPSRGTARPPVVGMSNIRDLFTQLDAAAITKGAKVWATEFAYQTNPPDDLLGISATLQGRFIGEAFDWLDSTRRVTVAIWYGFTDPADITDWQGGTYYADGTPKVSLAWWRRAISVPIGMTRRGAYVRVWSRSMVNPSATRIAISTNGRSWRLLPAVGRKPDGTTTLRSRVFRTTWFATWDGVRGPARIVLVR